MNPTDPIRITLCSNQAEWTLAKTFRQRYFFDNVPIEDPYTWTFDHKDHRHYVLYQGDDLVGYTHIQLWPEKRAAIRIIAIDEEIRGQNLGSHFMSALEGLLRDEGYKLLHAEASPSALNFYLKLGYQEMPFDDPDGYESDENDTAVGKIL